MRSSGSALLLLLGAKLVDDPVENVDRLFEPNPLIVGDVSVEAALEGQAGCIELLHHGLGALI